MEGVQDNPRYKIVYMNIDIFETNNEKTVIHQIVTGKADFIFKEFLHKSNDLIFNIDETLVMGDKRRLERILNEYIKDLKIAILDVSEENKYDILFDLQQPKVGKNVDSRNYPERSRKSKVWATHWVQFYPEESR